MPIYRYQCKKCSQIFSVLELAGDPETDRCEHCNSKRVERIPSVPGLQFKGKGFYANDRSKGRPESAATASSASGGNGEPKSNRGSTESSSGGTTKKASEKASKETSPKTSSNSSSSK